MDHSKLVEDCPDNVECGRDVSRARRQLKRRLNRIQEDVKVLHTLLHDDPDVDGFRHQPHINALKDIMASLEDRQVKYFSEIESIGALLNDNVQDKETYEKEWDIQNDWLEFWDIMVLEIEDCLCKSKTRVSTCEGYVSRQSLSKKAKQGHADLTVKQAAEDIKVTGEIKRITAEKELEEIKIKREEAECKKLSLQKDIASKPVQSMGYKFEKTKLPVFSGDILQWPSWWEQYQRGVHQNPTLENIDRNNILRTLLSGEPLQDVVNCALTDDGYKIAIETLKAKYDDPNFIASAFYRAIEQVPPAVNTFRSIQSTFSMIESNLKAIEKLGDDINKNRPLITQVKSKFPKECREYMFTLSIEKAAIKDTLNFVRQAIPVYIQMKKESADPSELLCENISTVMISSSRSSQQQSQQSSSRAPPPGATSAPNAPTAPTSPPGQQAYGPPKPPGRWQSVREVKCPFCKDKHWADQCKKYPTVKSRLKRLEELPPRCLRCFRNTHETGRCRIPQKCPYCSKTWSHHRSLCPEKFGESNQVSAITNTIGINEASPPIPIPSDVDNVCNVACAQYTTEVIFQTARFNARPESGPSCQCYTMTCGMFDCACSRAFIRRSLANKMGLIPYRKEWARTLTFGSTTPRRELVDIADIMIQLKDGREYRLNVAIVDNIIEYVKRGKVNADVVEFLEANDYIHKDYIPKVSSMDEIEILISVAEYLDLMGTEKVEVRPNMGLYVVNSELGWILSGRNQHGSEFESNFYPPPQLAFSVNTQSYIDMALRPGRDYPCIQSSASNPNPCVSKSHGTRNTCNKSLPVTPTFSTCKCMHLFKVFQCIHIK